MTAPYKSNCYELTATYERFGNYTLKPGYELYLYITDTIVPGIPSSRYSISNKMKVYDYEKQEFVKVSLNTNYPTVNLYNRITGKSTTYLLHRLYMLAFCYFPGCEEYEVNHIDGNKFNNDPSNLEWMTHRNNMAHAHYYLLKGKLSDNDIASIIELYNSGEKISDIASMYNISSGYVSDIIYGKQGRPESIRLQMIKQDHKITRDKQPLKLSEELLAEIASRYNSGEEYYMLAKEYNLDRSYLTKKSKNMLKVIQK